eukprot:2269537-Pyramimonas_sp.AAC.1
MATATVCISPRWFPWLPAGIVADMGVHLLISSGAVTLENIRHRALRHRVGASSGPSFIT